MAARLERIVLVHGGSHGAWCWEELVPLLEAKGFTVDTLDLPGLGDDPTPPKDVTLQSYFDRVAEVVEAGATPAMVVGHSLGGMPISGAGEAIPDKIGRLVYLAAVLPVDGMALADFHPGEKGAFRAVIPGNVEGAFDIDPAIGAMVFYNSCPPGVAERAGPRLKPQATGPFPTPVALSPGRWGAIPKTYIVTLRDEALPTDKQLEMLARSPAVRRRTMDTDHSPFYSDPQGLADILEEEAQL